MSSENNLEDRLSSYKLQPDGRVQYLPPEEEIEKEKERRLTGLGYLEENVRPILEKINSIVLGGKGEIFTTDPADLSLTDPHYPNYPAREPWIKLQWRHKHQTGPDISAHSIQILYTNKPDHNHTYKYYRPFPSLLNVDSRLNPVEKGVTLVRRGGWGQSADIITEGKARIGDDYPPQTRPITRGDWEPELLSLILYDMQLEIPTERYERFKRPKTAIESILKEKEAREKERKEVGRGIDPEEIRNHITEVLHELNELSFNREAEIVPWAEEENTHAHAHESGSAMDGFEWHSESHTVNAYVAKMVFPKIDQKIIFFMIKSYSPGGNSLPLKRAVYGKITKNERDYRLCHDDSIIFSSSKGDWREKLRATITGIVINMHARVILGDH